MIQKLKRLLAAVVMVASFAVPVAVPVAVSAQNLDSDSPQISGGLCSGSNLDAANSNSCNSQSLSTAANTQMTGLIHLVINVFSLIVGVVSVIMIIVGGFRYITSGGASDSITAAKNTIIYAIIGLVIVALAQFIVHFVLGRVAAGQ